MVKIAIVGSRTFNDWDLLWNKMAKHFSNLDEVTIVSGGARGADALAKRFAETAGLDYEEYPADWNRYGNSAGPRRNAQIVEAVDVVVVFWDGKSRGSKDSINKALEAKKNLFIFMVQNGKVV